MLRQFFYLLVISLLSFPVYSQKKSHKKPAVQNIILTDNGSSRYTILLPAHPTVFEEKAATVLQNYLLQISGAALPVITADKHRSSYEIVLGQNERTDELSAGINYQQLKEDGFLIKTDSSRLIIAGGNEKGNRPDFAKISGAV